MTRRPNLSSYMVSVESEAVSVPGSMEDDLSLAELETVADETNRANEAVSTTTHAIAELSEVATDLQTVLRERGSMTTLEVKLIRRRVEDAVAPISDVMSPDALIASQESFDHNSAVALRISMESVAEALKKAWAWILEKLEAMADAIVAFFSSTEKYLERIEVKATQLKKHISELKDEDRQEKLELRNPSRFALSNGIDPSKTITLDGNAFVKQINAMSGFLVDAMKVDKSENDYKRQIDRAKEVLRFMDEAKSAHYSTRGDSKSAKMVDQLDQLEDETIGALTNHLTKVAERSGFFGKVKGEWLSFPVMGGDQVSMSIGITETVGGVGGAEEALKAVSATKIRITKAISVGGSIVSLNTSPLLKSQMTEIVEDLIKVINSAQQFYKDKEGYATDLKSLRRELDKSIVNAASIEVDGIVSEVRTKFMTVLTSLNKGLDLQKAISKLAITHVSNGLTYVADNARGYKAA